MTSKSGKCEYPREDALIISEYATSKENAPYPIKTISAGGLFVKASWKIDVGQPLTLKFPLLFDID